MADPRLLTNTSGQASQSSPSLSQTLSRESIFDSLKLILAGAPLGEVLTTIARLIEGQSPGTLCSIFLLEGDGFEYASDKAKGWNLDARDRLIGLHICGSV